MVQLTFTIHNSQTHTVAGNYEGLVALQSHYAGQPFKILIFPEAIGDNFSNLERKSELVPSACLLAICFT